MPKATFADEGLFTITSVPYTSVSFADNFERPLTPNELLMFSPIRGLPHAKTEIANMIFTHRWRQIQAQADLFG